MDEWKQMPSSSPCLATKSINAIYDLGNWNALGKMYRTYTRTQAFAVRTEYIQRVNET